MEERRRVLVEFFSLHDKENFVRRMRENKTGATLGISYSDFIPEVLQEERRGLVTLGH